MEKKKKKKKKKLSVNSVLGPLDGPGTTSVLNNSPTVSLKPQVSSLRSRCYCHSHLTVTSGVRELGALWLVSGGVEAASQL